jgi:hypothetical protein
MARNPLALSDKSHNKAIQQEGSTEDDLRLLKVICDSFFILILEVFPTV